MNSFGTIIKMNGEQRLSSYMMSDSDFAPDPFHGFYRERHESHMSN